MSSAFWQRFSSHYLARHFDRAAGSAPPSGSGFQPVYALGCADCGPADAEPMRLVDMVPQPPELVGDWESKLGATEEGPDGIYEEPVAPVYAQVTQCQKDWVGAEEYVEYDMGLGHTRTVSAEMTMLLEGMHDCTGEACEYVLLEYDEAEGGWTGSLSMSAGTATFMAWGEWNGLVEEWFLDMDGCTGTLTQPLETVCDYPLRLVGTGGGGPFGSSCCTAAPPPSPLYVWEKITPVYMGRLIDADGSAPVYLVAECCDDGCPFTPGCCDGIPIDAGIDFTIFNIVTTNGSPPCARTCSGATVGATTSEGCVTWSVTTCSGPHTICFQCSLSASGAAEERGWEHYRILASSVLYSPTSGSCDPFSVTFDGLPWTSPDPGGACSGTYSVTVTR